MNTKKPQKSSKENLSEKHKNTYSNENSLVKSDVFGIGITNETSESILEYLGNFLKNSQKKLFIVTPNPEMIMLSRKNSDFKKVLNEANLALCDGIGLYKAAHFLGIPLKERIIGTTFMEKVCEMVADWPITVGFLGSGPHVAEKVGECLSKRYPGLKVVYTAQEWDASQPQKPIDILFVAFGAPKQEFWMQKNLSKLPVRVMMGVGGAFDQIIDPSLRPPMWLHSIGLGWLYRLIREPWRLKRQMQLIPFVFLTLKEKFA